MSLRYPSLAHVPQHLLRERGSSIEQVQPPKRAKYGNKIVEADGYRFDSAFEAQRYAELKTMQECGLIRGLRVHPVYALHVKETRIGVYELDFDYFQSGKRILEDCKSEATKTALFHWKRDHLKAEYDLDVRVIQKQRKRAA